MLLRTSAKHFIETIDCMYMKRPFVAAAYLMVHDRRAVFIDNNTNHSVPILLNSLKSHDLQPQDVTQIIVTHIHLDHAGGTGRLAQLCPNAQVLAHPNASPHLIDPSKIIHGAKSVYGEEAFNELYGGEILPVASERVISMKDGDSVHVDDDCELRFYHTRGHAKHHMIIHDTVSNSVFTGDAFGISYLPILSQLGHTKDDYFLFPSSSPIDFELDEAHKALDVITGLNADRCYPTHFGVWENVAQGVAQMHEHLYTFGGMMEVIRRKLRNDANAQHEVEQTVRIMMEDFFKQQLSQRGILYNDVRELLQSDIELNASGLVIAVARLLKKEKQQQALNN